MNPTSGYYSRKLSAERLRRCYDVAPPRVRQYLEAEVEHVCERIHATDVVLELGCGYGRALGVLVGIARTAVGIDTAIDSLLMAGRLLENRTNCHVVAMDAGCLGFSARSFDVTVCIQNGISALNVDQRELIRASLRVTKPGGTVLLSTYAEAFWDDRLDWFHRQAAHSLIGEIDEEKTGNGVIVCKDGFKATTVASEGFMELCGPLNIEPILYEVDRSSLFCEIRVGEHTG